MELVTTEVLEVLEGELIGTWPVINLSRISIDSRSLHNAPSTLFFALLGDNHNAHDYIQDAIQGGVVYFIVSEVPTIIDQKINYLIVDDTKKALHELARYHRSKFSFPLIGVTGSNGKTIVKEWLSYLLAPDFTVVKSPKSYNSQVGVPLSLFLMNQSHTLGVFEAGISMEGEMDALVYMMAPDIGVLTNIGSAHDNGFPDRAQKVKEKCKLLKGCTTIIYKSDALVEAVLKEELISSTTQKLFNWSFEDKNATVYVLDCVSKKKKTQLTLVYKKEHYVFDIPFIDQAAIENAITCFVTLVSLAIPLSVLLTRMAQIYPVEMRLQLKPAINDCTLIDDSYNSDIQSLIIALDFLEQQRKEKHKTVILSDINESGYTESELYEVIVEILDNNKIDTIIVVGEKISKHLKKYKHISCFVTTDDLVSSLKELHLNNQFILIKGSRSFQFEKIVAALEYQKHETVLEVNLDAITSNLLYYKSKLMPQVKIMVMVKAFGYGNGGFELAKLLSHHRVDYLGVAFADEGIVLKKQGITIPIMVMNPEIGSYNAIVAHDLEPEIYSFRGLKAFLELADKINLEGYPIHIKIDTGMHRLGFDIDDMPELISLLNTNQAVIVRSVLSHFAASDDLEFDDFTKQQIDLFEKVKNKISNLKQGEQPIFHIANTSGIINYPESHFDMVRLGIGLYGIGNSEEEKSSLQNVSTLKSVLSQIKNIKKGDSIGYGRSFFAKEAMVIGIVPIGYADGLPRILSQKGGQVFVKGKKVPIIGKICMDMLMIDLSGHLCEEGDEVIFFGEEQKVTVLAEQLDTISYEILTQVSHRVKRIYYRN